MTLALPFVFAKFNNHFNINTYSVRHLPENIAVVG
jgi:hypothetical protein